MDITAPHLPPLQEDPSLERLLPPHLNHREFRRVPHAPDRYCASLLGFGVWDLYRARYLIPQTGSDGRRRFRINPGPGAKPVWVYYSVALALLVLGPPPHPKAQAHHKNEDPTADRTDRWDNIVWQSPRQNRARAAEHQAQKRRMGQDNGGAKISDAQLVEFIRLHDDDARHGRPIPWDLYASQFYFNVSERHLRRIARGLSRRDRVAEIRKKIVEEEKTERQ